MQDAVLKQSPRGSQTGNPWKDQTKEIHKNIQREAIQKVAVCSTDSSRCAGFALFHKILARSCSRQDLALLLLAHTQLHQLRKTKGSLMQRTTVCTKDHTTPGIEASTM